MSTTVSVRLEDNVKDQLENLSKATRRSRSFLIAEAVEEYVALHAWQIKEINKGIAEANAGQLEDHAKVVKRWRKKGENSMDEESK